MPLTEQTCHSEPENVQSLAVDVTEVDLELLVPSISIIQFLLYLFDLLYRLRSDPGPLAAAAARLPSSSPAPPAPLARTSPTFMQTNSYSDQSSLPKPTANTDTHDETCTLLNHEQSPPSLESQTTKPSKNAPTPLPLAQLACLCLVRTCEPINFTHIFPYVNQMLVEVNVTDDLSRVGFYSGLVESAFAVAQLFSIYQWARLSGAFSAFFTYITTFAYVFPDIIGRRPVIFSES